jgi:hypothetical protein
LQLVEILTVSADGAVPIAHRLVDGSTEDSTTHIETWDSLVAMVGSESFTYVADCKLATRDNLDHIAAKGGRFLTILPRTRREDEIGRSWIATGEPAWQEIARSPGKRKADPAAPARWRHGARVDSTSGPRSPSATAVSQLATSPLASLAGIADGKVVRGQHLRAGTARTKATETLSVTNRNRKNDRRAVTMQRSEGAGITSDAARTVANTARPSRSAIPISPSGRHILRRIATRPTYWSVVVVVSPRWATHHLPKASSSSASALVRPNLGSTLKAITPNEHKWSTITLSERGDRR